MNFLNTNLLSFKLLIMATACVSIVSLFVYLNSDNFGTDDEAKSINVITYDDEDKIFKTNNPLVDKIFSVCGKDIQCTIGGMQYFAETENKETILKTVDGLVLAYAKEGIFCHHQVHSLGKFLYTFTGDLREALLHSNQKCGGALYHGVVESFFSTQKFSDKSKIENMDIINICPEDHKNTNSLQRWQCIHGIGHGLSIVYDYNILSAVTRCEEFDSRFEELSCSKGVFMENTLHYFYTKEGDFEKDNIFYPCNIVDKKFAPACYHYHTLYLNHQRDVSVYDGGFEECDKIEPKEFVKYCYYGLGKELAYDVYDKMPTSIPICQQGDPQLHSYCFTGLLLTLVNGWGTDHAFEYCKILPTKFKIDCYDGLGKWIHMKHSTEVERKQECLKANSEKYYNVCIKSNLDNLELL